MSARNSLPKSIGHFELPDWNEDEPLRSDLGADPVGGQGHGSQWAQCRGPQRCAGHWSV